VSLELWVLETSDWDLRNRTWGEKNRSLSEIFEREIFRVLKQKAGITCFYKETVQTAPFELILLGQCRKRCRVQLLIQVRLCRVRFNIY
jgi:hypothetical protein